jgi:outer membrane receptor protein involved in Fe transport
MRFPRIAFPLLLWSVLLLVLRAEGQSPNGNINGLVVDPSSRLIIGAEIIAVNDVTGVQHATKTNNEGIYVLPDLPPGPYRIQVSKVGFKTLIKPDIILNVQDALSINFTLPVGALYETMTVEGGAPLVDTESAAVSTVVDRQFAENLPLNGRSFQSLIQLTPGVVFTASNSQDSGQFSINGQRASANYWMVDGVSANIGTGASSTGTPGNGLGGAIGSFSALGGTNSLVSVDAMQEFRIQTSTYAPEFGRTPGGQISIVTRSGAKQFHGTAFDYLRNDILDANNWFADSVGQPKPEERQNDFGGTFSGPVLKDKTFFFFSYEGLRLRLPQTTLTKVPDLTARQNAIPAMKPFLDAFPLDPSQPDNAATGVADFNQSYSNPASLNAYSVRIDHRLNDKLSLFGRYNYSPSSIVQRGGGNSSLNTLNLTNIALQTATVGASWGITSTAVDDLRMNYSKATASGSFSQDDFGGAVSLASLPFPAPYTSQNGYFNLTIFNLGIGSNLQLGQVTRSVQRQINVVDSLSLQKGSHSLKFGVDFRRLSPEFSPRLYEQFPGFLNVASAEAGNLYFSATFSNLGATFLFRNLGIYAQDTWKANPHLTLTYGLRWDTDFVPQSLNGPAFAAVTGFNLNDLSELGLAPAGTEPYRTTYRNFAPRVGVAYQISRNQNFQTVLRGGFGIFFDLATSEMGNQISLGSYPFGATNGPVLGGTFPLSPAAAAPPPIVPPNATSGNLFATDPNLLQPYTLEWNVALEQAVGKTQTITATYVGASGKRLLQSLGAETPSFHAVQLVTNVGSSDYGALQLQFQRRLSRGLQALASYTWSHSIDTGSAGSTALLSNSVSPGAISSNRASSDFDIRHTLTTGVTYAVPAPKTGALTNAILRGWSIQSIIQARTAPPVDVSDLNFSELPFNGGIIADIRPDIVQGQPFYLYGANCASVLQAAGTLAPGAPCPGGKGFNPNAFTDPPVDPTTGNPLQGDVPRNFLRGFGTTQWDFAVHRAFPIHDSLNLEFRAEMFNVVNHPNFAPPNGGWPFGFGASTQTLGQFLNGGTTNISNAGGGAFNPLYQIGGPRSIQLALKLQF